MGILDFIIDAAQRGAGLLAPNKEDVNLRANIPGLLADFTPVVGDAKSVYDGVQSARQGDYLGAGLGALGALPLMPNIAGMFIGKGAKTWDAVMASKALEMEKAGADPRTIWKETGNWKGPDGKWRQEIPDNKSVISDLRQKSLDDVYPLPDVLEHRALYEAYPQLRDTQVWPVGGRGGAYSNGNIDIGVDRPPITGQRKTALHEVQHNIQDVEDWAKGGSSMMAFANKEAHSILGKMRQNMTKAMPIEEYAKQAWGSAKVTPEIISDYEKSYLPSIKKISPEIDRMTQETAAKEYYKRLAGEAEARATQSRMNLDANQRRALFPEDSYDVPIDQLIIRGLLQ